MKIKTPKSILLEGKRDYTLVGWTPLPAKLPSRVWIPCNLFDYDEHAELGARVKTGEILARSKQASLFHGARGAPLAPLNICSPISGFITKIGKIPHPNGVALSMLSPSAKKRRPDPSFGGKSFIGDPSSVNQQPGFPTRLPASTELQRGEPARQVNPFGNDSTKSTFQEDAEGFEILSDGKDELIGGLGQERLGWQNLDFENTQEIFQNAGLVTVDREMKPLHQKILEQGSSEDDRLIISAVECEPYVSSAYSLVMSHPLEVLKGAEILRKQYGAGKIVFVVGEDREDTKELLRSKIYFMKWKHASVLSVPSLYPNDEPKQLVRLIEAVSDVSGSLSVIDQAATAYAVYDAVVRQKPLIERVVSIAGECFAESKNAWVRIGSPIEEVLKIGRGLLREPEMLIAGGPMRGRAQQNLHIPVLASTEALLALPEEVAKPENSEACIRCGRCLEVCPVDISPAMITIAAEKDEFEIAQMWGAKDCFGCGNCAYVCPSKRPMVELIRYAQAKSSSPGLQDKTVKIPALAEVVLG